MVRFDVLTIFPEQIEQFSQFGLLRIAADINAIELKVHNLRDWTEDKHKTVDDRPYGGGAGMVMKVEPIFKAVEQLRNENTQVVIFTPRGELLNQKRVEQFAADQNAHYILICGHYEGIDERVHQHLAHIELSIGDYILSGGEIPTLIFVDSISRLLPGVLGNEASAEDESISSGLLEYPQYTRPEEFNGWRVPEILLSGDHGEIDKWRREEAKRITRKRRPDLL